MNDRPPFFKVGTPHFAPGFQAPGLSSPVPSGPPQFKEGSPEEEARETPSQELQETLDAMSGKWDMPKQGYAALKAARGKGQKKGLASVP
jgi:hypothetical protein